MGGCISKKFQVNDQQVNTNDCIHSMLINDKTQKIFSILNKIDDNHLLIPINFRNDTLLHFACARDNKILARYIIKRNSKTLQMANAKNKFPYQVTNNKTCQQIKKKMQKIKQQRQSKSFYNRKSFLKQNKENPQFQPIFNYLQNKNPDQI